MTSGRRARIGPVTLAVLLAAASGCAPRVAVSLPGGTGTDDPAAIERFADATRHCREVSTWSAEMSVAGTVRQRNLRVKVLAGTTARGNLRLEGLAPFGAPIFVLVASEAQASLLLPRDQRVVRDVPVSQLLEALVGLSLSGEDLHALLTGCPGAASEPRDGLRLADGWHSVRTGDGRTAYLHDEGGTSRVMSAELGPLTVGYGAFAGSAPRELRLVTGTTPAASARLRLQLSQVEENPSLPDEAFRLDEPPGVRPMSLAELRAWGPGAS